MGNLGKIKIEQKTGSEPLLSAGKDTGVSLLDFWRWNGSDIVSNTTRGCFAEFIVASALNIDLSAPRDEWSAWDLTSPEGVRIEVKSAAYLQSWAQSSLSKISFSIRPARAWDGNSGEMKEVPSRPSDLYVFCLLKHQDKNTLNPLDLDQWDFYVVPTSMLNNYQRSSTSITLKSLMRLSSPVQFPTLRDEVLSKSGK
jgi:hypothetical protein